MFEFGKVYNSSGVGNFREEKHLSIFLTGRSQTQTWNQPDIKTNLYYMKGVVQNIGNMLGIPPIMFREADDSISLYAANNHIGVIKAIEAKTLQLFSIKEQVYHADLNWDSIIQLLPAKQNRYKEIAKFPAVERDLAIVVNTDVKYAQVEEAIRRAKVQPLKNIRLFDLFESEKLGKDKKSFAVNFLFSDETKTLTDEETEQFMQKITQSLQKNINAEIRK